MVHANPGKPPRRIAPVNEAAMRRLGQCCTAADQLTGFWMFY
jgi:hypothetical protein